MISDLSVNSGLLSESITDNAPPSSSSAISLPLEKPPTNFFGFSSNLLYFCERDIMVEKSPYSMENDRCDIMCELMMLYNPVTETWAVKNINSTLHTVLKIVSLHKDECCVEFCKRMTKELLQARDVHYISLSSRDIFMILFNYGIDIKKAEMLETICAVKTVPVTLCIAADKIPNNWTYNLEAVLNCLRLFLECVFFKYEDLCDIIIYLLWMGVDSTVHKSNIYSEAQNCISISLKRFPKETWLNAISFISHSVTSTQAIPSHQWNYVYYMTNTIPCTTYRALQMRKHIAFVALKKLLGDFSFPSAPLEYSYANFSTASVLYILNSVFDLSTLHIAFKYLKELFTHLVLNSDKEYHAVYAALKNFENTVISRLFVATSDEKEYHAVYAALKNFENTVIRRLFVATSDELTQMPYPRESEPVQDLSTSDSESEKENASFSVRKRPFKNPKRRKHLKKGADL